MPRRSPILNAILVVAVWCAGAAPARGAPPPRRDQREVEAREAFVTGRYQQALDLFGKLYAETLHPTYLRNIGRCYQKLGDPDRAISTFRDYLRKAAPLPASERAEIDDYIAEMEALKKERAQAARPGPAPVPAPPPTAPAAAASAPAYVSAPAAPAAGPEQRSGTRWWLWTAVGAAVVGAAGITAALVLSKPTDAPCPTGIACYRP
jgi:hypothetical protein